MASTRQRTSAQYLTKGWCAHCSGWVELWRIVTKGGRKECPNCGQKLRTRTP